MAETPIAATYVSASSFTVAANKSAEFVTGVRVQADCGADGIKYGTVTSAGTTTVVVVLDSGSLTSNLTGVLHGNDVPASLCNHGHTSAADGGLLATVWSPPVAAGYMAANKFSLAGDQRSTFTAGRPLIVGSSVYTSVLSSNLASASTVNNSVISARYCYSDSFTTGEIRVGAFYGVHVCSVSFNLNVDQGATITAATLVATANGGHDTATARIYGAAIDAATDPTSCTSINAIAKTSAYATWTINSGVGMSGSVTSVDFASALQEVVNRPGFVKGNKAMIIIVGQTATSGYRMLNQSGATVSVSYAVSTTEVTTKDSTVPAGIQVVKFSQIVPESIGAHASIHATGGRDALAPADIGAAASSHDHAGVYATASHDHAATYAPIAKGVTNGDSHDHSGGDGAQISYTALADLPTIPTTASQVGAIPAAVLGAAGGVATLGPDGKVPAAQLPAIAGDVAVIRVPSIASPADGAVLTTSMPTIVCDAYRNVYGVAQASMVVEVATDALFATVVYAHTTTGAATSYAMPAGHIEPLGEYWIGVTYTDEDGAESARGVAHVTASAQLEHVATPTLTAPVAGATVYEQPTLTSSAFAVTSGADTHAASRWQIKTSAGSWDTPLWDSGEVASLTSVTVPAGYLTAGGNGYDVRMAHKGTALGWSDWSPSVSVVSAAQFSQIIGVVCTATGGGGGTWAWVDAAGNAVTPAVGYFNGHPVFGGIADVTVDGQAMVKIPKFYIKRATLAAGAYSGKEAWFISDQPADGFRLHPAFYNAGAAVDQVYVGKYQASSDGSKLKSAAGVLPAVSTSLTAFQGLATARNVSGVTGFMLWSIYHWSAIQWLYLVEMGTMDSQTKTGAGRTSASSAANVDASDVAQATYRGIVGLWGNVYQWMDGLKTDGTQICLWDNVGNKSWVTTGRTRAVAAGWIYPLTFMSQSGGSYNFADVFLGDTGPTSNSGATAPDGQYLDSAGASFPVVGGRWSDGADAGLWYVFCSVSASVANTGVGARLAKV